MAVRPTRAVCNTCGGILKHNWTHAMMLFAHTACGIHFVLTCNMQASP